MRIPSASLVAALLLSSLTAVLADPLPQQRPTQQTSAAAAPAASNQQTATSAARQGTQTTASANTRAGTSDTAAASSTGDSANSVITAAPTAPVATISAPAISITGGEAAPSLTSALPSIAGAYRYIKPSVPVTANAPYLRKSNAPEGTFFIATGAVLGLLGVGIILWRALVAWSLHRSVRRAQEQQSLLDAKALIGPPGGGFYGQHTFAPSTNSFDQLVRTGREKNTAQASRNSLFFSPTGAGMNNNASQNTLHSTTFLPSGYYPSNAQSTYQLNYASQSNPALAAATTPTHGSFAGNRTSYVPAQYSPAVPLSGGSQQTGQRAPSAFLDELLDHQAPRSGSSGFRG